VVLALILATAILGAGFIANSVLPLYPITAAITVKNSATDSPIQGAAVSAYVMGILVGSGVTGSNGVATLTCNTNIAVNFVVVASGYMEKTQTLTLNAAGTATIYLTPGSSPSYVKVRVYTPTLELYKVRDVKITGGAVEGRTNEDSYVDLLCPAGVVVLTVDGSLATVKRSSIWEGMSFGTFQTQITASEGAVYTVYVPSGTTQSGQPDFPADDWIAVTMEWLGGNTMGVPNYLIAAILILLASRR
jgi:hypothetical protein